VKILRGILRVLFVLWAGSLWSLLWVAATLFNLQSDRHLAGAIAGKLFGIETYLGLIVVALALALPKRARYTFAYVAAALLATNEWVLKRVMSAAQAEGSALGLTFGAWHGVSAVLYVIACIAVLVLVWNEDFR
jgi:hypothetical protein